MINIALVGFGFMGMTHAGNILKNKDLRLASIVDKNTDNIHKNLEAQVGNFSIEDIDAEQLSNVKIFSDFAECLKVEKPDACVIAVHTNLHFVMAKLALDAGVHVFLEKPFCFDMAEGEELIRLARANNKILMIGHVLRFMPAYLTLRNWIVNEEFGKLEFLSLSRFSGVPAWGQWKDRQKDFCTSASALFDLVIHDIDFAQWVCGIPDEISANCLPGKLSNYDYISSLWKYKQTDLRVKIEGGNTFHTDFPFHASYSARFEKASVLYYPKDSEKILISTDNETTNVPAGNANDGFKNELEYFISCITENKQPDFCTPESALQSIAICHRHINDE